MNYRFWLKTDIRFGVSSSLEVVKYVEERKYKKIAVIADHGILKNPQFKNLLKKLKNTKAKIQIEIVTITEANYDFLEKFRKKFSKNTDLFIGIGGGSVLDITKAISVLIVNSKPAIKYRGFGKIVNAGPPVIAIPTTAGSGSEVTPNASFIDTKKQLKLGINTDKYLPVLVILDPLFSITCPKEITIGTGMDALVHSLETYTSPLANDINKLFSKEAIRLILDNLPKAASNPRNMQARQNLQIAALLAGATLINGKTGVAADLSYPLGVRFKVPHGLAGAVFLAQVVAWNAQHGANIYKELDDVVPKNVHSNFVDYLQQLSKNLEIPNKLNLFSVTKNDIHYFIDEVFENNSIPQNPVAITRKDVTTLLEKML